jgi:hypothetical protein
VIFGERYLRHLLNSYQQYFNEVRPHLSLTKDASIPREVERGQRVCSPLPILGGLHHRYVRVRKFHQGQLIRYCRHDQCTGLAHPSGR